MNDILITGTDGFIGGVLKNHLLKCNMRVMGTTFFHPPGENEVKFDITDKSNFSVLPKKNFDVVIHTIGIMDQTVPSKKMFAVNSEGTKNLLEWLHDHPCKHFIQLSSIAVYGFKTMGENRTEADTARYIGRFWIPYGRSKAKAEIYIEQSGVPYTLLRCPSVFGANDTFTSEAIIPRLQNDMFYFSGNKDRKFSLLYVKNLGPIIQRLIEIGPQNDVFNCTDSNITWKQFVSEFARVLKIPLHERKKPIIGMLRHIHDKMYVYMMVNSYFGAHFPNDKLMQRLQITPPFPWQDGVKDAIDEYLVRVKS